MAGEHMELWAAATHGRQLAQAYLDAFEAGKITNQSAPTHDHAGSLALAAEAMIRSFDAACHAEIDGRRQTQQ